MDALSVFFAKIPPKIAEATLLFIQSHALAASESSSAPILNRVIFGTNEGKHLIENILKESMKLIEMDSIVHHAIKIIKLWLLLPFEEPLLISIQPVEGLSVTSVLEIINVNSRKLLGYLFSAFHEGAKIKSMSSLSRSHVSYDYDCTSL